MPVSANRFWISRRRHAVLFSRYSELPSRSTRRVTRTLCHSTPSSSAQSVNVSETSANPTGLRVSAPLKITSAISSPRSDLADCSPSAQRTASSTLDFPQPFGPTIAVTPSWKSKTVLSTNDLKPNSSSDCKCILGQPGPSEPQYSTLIGVTSGKSHNRRGSGADRPQDIVDGRRLRSSSSKPKLQITPI